MTILTLVDGTSVRITDDQFTVLRNHYGNALRRVPRREIIRYIHAHAS